jgi:2-isopropylmalate synthase
MEIVRMFDTTLRDGEQSPGATMTSAEKLEVARALPAGVDDSWFPAASPTISRPWLRLRSATLVEGEASPHHVLARPAGRIEAAWEASPAARPHPHLPPPEIHMKHKLKMDPETSSSG